METLFECYEVKITQDMTHPETHSGVITLHWVEGNGTESTGVMFNGLADEQLVLAECLEQAARILRASSGGLIREGQ